MHKVILLHNVRVLQLLSQHDARKQQDAGHQQPKPFMNKSCHAFIIELYQS